MIRASKIILVAISSACSSVFAQPLPPLMIRGAAVFDAAAARMVPDQTVIVEDGRIRAVVPESSAPPKPEGARVIDGHGKYVIPGLIDAHAHVAHHAGRQHVTADETLPLFVANGVTSLRSTGDPVLAETGVAHYAASHPDECPRVFLASPLIDGDPPYHPDNGVSLTDPNKVAAFVDDMAAWDVKTLKIYVGTARPVGQAVIREAHRRGIKVTGHLGLYTAQEAVEDGIDSLEHIWSVFNYIIPPEVAALPNHRPTLDLTTPICESLVKAIAERKVAVDPTLVVMEEIYLNDLPEIYDNPDLNYVPERMLKAWQADRVHAVDPATLELRRQEIEKYKELTGILYRAGVTLLAGTDTPEPWLPPGFSLHRELQLLVDSGLPPAAAIQCATINNAAAVNQSSQLGSVESGKIADLVILSADPTEDIRNTRKIDYVVRGGRVVDPARILKRFEGNAGGASFALTP